MNIPVDNSHYLDLEDFADFLVFLGFLDISDMSETGERLQSDRKNGGDGDGDRQGDGDWRLGGGEIGV